MNVNQMTSRQVAAIVSAAHHGFPFARCQREHVDFGVLEIVSVVPGEQNRLAAWKNLRPTMRGLALLRRSAKQCDRSAAGGHARQTGRGALREDDIAVFAPV